MGRWYTGLVHLTENQRTSVRLGLYPPSYPQIGDKTVKPVGKALFQPSPWMIKHGSHQEGNTWVRRLQDRPGDREATYSIGLSAFVESI